MTTQKIMQVSSAQSRLLLSNCNSVIITRHAIYVVSGKPKRLSHADILFASRVRLNVHIAIPVVEAVVNYKDCVRIQRGNNVRARGSMAAVIVGIEVF